MLTTYIFGSLALIIKPGPDLMCLLATALSEGRVRAMALMAGQMFGCWLWILLLPLGVASFFTSHPAVMTAIQIVGIGYIGYLAFLSLREAVRDFRSSATGGVLESRAQGSAPARRRLTLFRRGVAMAMSNPLTILFFLAFLPHFTRTGSSLSPAFQTLLLGTLFCALVPLVDLPVIFAASAFRSRLVGNPKFAAGLKLVSGLMLMAVVAVLACSVSFAGRP